VRALDQAEVPLRGLTVNQPSLDDVFLRATGETMEDAVRDAVTAADTTGGEAQRGARGTVGDSQAEAEEVRR